MKGDRAAARRAGGAGSDGAGSRPSGRRKRRRARDWGHALPLLALWLLPVVTVAVAVPLTAALDEESISAPQPTVVTVGTRAADQAIAVNVVASLGARPEIRTGRAGIVTALAAPGPISAGATAFRIDDVPVLAYQGPVLYRDLSRGDQGSDVEALSRFLAQMQFLDEDKVDTAFGSDVEQGVESLQDSIGVEADGVFRLSYVAYVPDTATEITESAVEVGDAVAAGAPVLVASPPVESVRFEAVDQGGSLDAYSGAELALRVGPEVVDVDGIELIGGEARSVAATLDEVARAGAVTADRVEAGPTTYRGGILALREPTVSGVVPSTAVAMSADGTACVIVVHGDADIADDREVVTLTKAEAGNELGTVAVDADVIGQSVVRDASELSEAERSCE